MAITVGLFGGDEARRAMIRDEVARPLSVVVERFSGRLSELPTEQAPPIVVLLGVPEILRRGSADPFYDQLIGLQTRWPAVRVAVWADAIQPGASFDLVRVGVLGIVLWPDARPGLWPLLVRGVYARTQTWSRPFDSRPAWRAARESAAAFGG